MSVDAFKTRKGDPEVEIPGAGIANDSDGVPVERVALIAHELQDDDGNPLSGQKLTAAAKDFAAARGLVVGKGRDQDEPAPVGATTTAPEAAQQED